MASKYQTASRTELLSCLALTSHVCLLVLLCSVWRCWCWACQVSWGAAPGPDLPSDTHSSKPGALVQQLALRPSPSLARPYQRVRVPPCRRPALPAAGPAGPAAAGHALWQLAARHRPAGGSNAARNTARPRPACRHAGGCWLGWLGWVGGHGCQCARMRVVRPAVVARECHSCSTLQIQQCALKHMITSARLACLFPACVTDGWRWAVGPGAYSLWCPRACAAAR